jgi:hypothetical protein
MSKLKDFSKLFKSAIEKSPSLAIGVPEDKNARPGEQVTNAELAYLHTNGDPIMRLPPRPFLQPTLEENSKLVTSQIGAIVISSMNGEQAAAIEQTKQLGKALVQAVDINLMQGVGQPLSKKRIDEKTQKGSKYPETPLLDTTEMYNSISAVVNKETQ